MSYGDELKARRKECGWSQQKLARAAGVGINSVTRWENGKSNPNTASKDKLDDAIEDRLTTMGEDKPDDKPESGVWPPGPGPKPPKPKKSDPEISFAEEVDAAIKLAMKSGDPDWHILILPHPTKGLDFRACAGRNNGSK